MWKCDEFNPFFGTVWTTCWRRSSDDVICTPHRLWNHVHGGLGPSGGFLAGSQILEAGGNAVDAGVAIGLCMNVLETR